MPLPISFVPMTVALDGLGLGEVKCPYCIDAKEFDSYVKRGNVYSDLESFKIFNMNLSLLKLEDV